MPGILQLSDLVISKKRLYNLFHYQKKLEKIKYSFKYGFDIQRTCKDFKKIDTHTHTPPLLTLPG